MSVGIGSAPTLADAAMDRLTEAPSGPAFGTPQNRHIPEGMFWDRDYAEFLQEGDDPFIAGCRFHEGPDVVWGNRMHRGESGWIITRHALMEEVLINDDAFSGARGNLNELLGYDIRFYPLDCDPPSHHRYRQMIAPVFTPAAVKGLEGSIRDICATLVADLARKNGADFIADFASVFPSYVFLELVGLPREMLPQFMKWNESFVRGVGEERLDAAKAILNYLEGFLADQREGADRTDLMNAILGGREGLEAFDLLEALGTTYMLYVAGLDTVYSTTGWLVKHLAGDHGLQDRLRAYPADIPRAIDELTRAYSVSTTTRLVTRDIDFHGAPMRAGDTVFMPLYLSTRDPTRFADPHRIDVDRKSRHLTFGGGVHICLGFHLAKRELAIVLEMLLTTFARIDLQPGWTFHTEGPVLGLDKLPLTWVRADVAGNALDSAV